MMNNAVISGITLQPYTSISRELSSQQCLISGRYVRANDYYQGGKAFQKVHSS